MTIKTILCINKFILAVYYTKAKCFQYSIIDEYGTVLEHESICYTPGEGREIINPVSK